jgi:hypothetical protein
MHTPETPRKHPTHLKQVGKIRRHHGLAALHAREQQAEGHLLQSVLLQQGGIPHALW